MPESVIRMQVLLPPDEARRRILASADRYRFNPLFPSRAAGKRPFVAEERGREIAVSPRSWLPDLYGPEVAIALESTSVNVTELTGRIRVPPARRAVNATLLAIFVGLPLLALAAPGGVNRQNTLAMLAISFGLLVALPIAVRWFRRDDERLRAFVRACFVDAHL